AWSQREDTDDDLRRLNMARARDLKQLRDEFKFVLDETLPAPTVPKPAAPAPSTEGVSPDKSASPEARIKPAGDQPKAASQPVVKAANAALDNKGGSK